VLRSLIACGGFTKSAPPAAPCTGKPQLRIIRGGRQ
jgi:hypothetical protein